MSGQASNGRPLVQNSISMESLSPPGLSSRISSISDLSEAGGSPPELYDPQPTPHDFVSPQASMDHLQNRYSLVSEISDISHIQLTSSTAQEEEVRFNAAAPRYTPAQGPGIPSSPSSTYNRGPWSPTAYEPLSPAGSSRSPGGLTGRLQSIRRLASIRRSRHQTIPEEGDEMEVGLVGNAYNFGGIGTSYTTVDDIEEHDAGDNFVFDVTSLTGPMDSHTIKLERAGTLTGGLGVGERPDLQISSRDLVANSPTVPQRGLSRSLTRRTSRLARTRPSVRDMAQAEANRLGRVIEVVVEDGGETPPQSIPRSGNDEFTGDSGAGVDLSSLGGGADDLSKKDIAPGSQSRHSTYVADRALPSKTETFYPVANWKPHSMRWPYLTALVIISGGLAGVQEYIYQLSSRRQAMVPQQGLFTFIKLDDVSTWDYFTFKYLPTVLAVTFGILWQLTDFEVKRLEAYHQLSRKGGALAAESINVDYITIFSFFRPFQALRFRHWAVAISSVATLLSVSAVPVLQAASIVLEHAPAAKPPADTKLIVISGVWSRFLTSVLAFIALLGFALLIILQRRKSGLMTDVKGIAGIAAMATKSHILMDFKNLDTVPPQDIHMQLKNHRYTLRNSSLAPNEDRLSNHDKHKHDAHRLSRNPHPFMMRLVAGIPLISGMLTFQLFLPLVLFIRSASVVTDRASWFLTACSVLIKIAYQTLEQDLRMMEPFYKLSIRHASPKVLTLDYTGMAFAYMPIRAVWNGDFLVAAVGFGSVLAEILTVCVTSFAGISGVDFLTNDSHPRPGNDSQGGGDTADVGNGEETMLSFWVSFTLSMATLLYLISTAIVVYWRRRHPFLPRQPSTIASVLAYIHQSKMLYDFVADASPSSNSAIANNNASSDPTSSTYLSTSSTLPGNTTITTTTAAARRTGRQDVDNDEMVRRLVVAGKTYGLGWFTGRDGQTHCGVDVEELKGDYKHKVQKDARLADSGPWLGDWSVY